ncbi:hypothetical protein E5D57_003957 [Metarhizium anisopliae]|nr:hypothetical protein E5D57_003957 [Metarhizium anisopliae]
MAGSCLMRARALVISDEGLVFGRQEPFPANRLPDLSSFRPLELLEPQAVLALAAGRGDAVVGVGRGRGPWRRRAEQ